MRVRPAPLPSSPAAARRSISPSALRASPARFGTSTPPTRPRSLPTRPRVTAWGCSVGTTFRPLGLQSSRAKQRLHDIMNKRARLRAELAALDIDLTAGAEVIDSAL